MKKLMIAGIAGIFLLGMASCGHGSGCDAYGGAQSNWTKYKAEKQNTVELVKVIQSTLAE